MNDYGYRLLPGWDPKDPSLLPIGTRVKIRHFLGHKGRVVKWWGPLGPGGKQVYRVRYGPKGRRQDIDVMRDQLVVLPPKAAKAPAPPPADPQPG